MKATERDTKAFFSPLELKLARLMATDIAQTPVSNLAPESRETPRPIPTERLKLMSAGIKYLSQIIGQLVELLNQPEDDEYGVLRANRASFETACNILADAAIVAAVKGGRQIPYGCASTDSEGGVRIEWVRNSASVHLVIPATSNHSAYVYHELGQNYGTVRATPESLARYLERID